MNFDAVAKLVESEVIRTIRGYRGNLLVVKAAMEADAIPKGDEPGIAEHLAALQEYLISAGLPNTDAFLLRYALTVPGSQRGIAPPILVLDSRRGGFSERRKRESAAQVERLSEVLTLARRFLKSLPSDASKALLELANLVATPTGKHKSTLLDQIRLLTIDEARELTSVAVSYFQQTVVQLHEFGINLLHAVACFRFETLRSEACRALLHANCFWPSSVYRDADESVTQELLELLNSTSDELAMNHLVLCVAWTRNRLAEASFRCWMQDPPSWTSHLNVPLNDYLPFAGWSLNSQSQRVELISVQCHRIRTAEPGTPDACRCHAPSDLSCPQCHGQATVLFDFENSSQMLPENAPANVICCPYCSMFGPNFVCYSQNGSTEWLPSESGLPRTFDCHFETRYVTLESAECPPFASANVFELDDASAVGGIPMWLQDAEYPRCPECAELMTFLAQHDNSVVQEEGLYYAFFCPSCCISAVNYQQT